MMTDKMLLSRLGGGVLVCFLLGLAGCGGPVGAVSGKVSYKGETLGGGTIMFIAEDGRALGRSIIAPDGTYLIDKVPSGLVKITVETKSAKSAKPPPQWKGKNIPPEAQKGMYKGQENQGKYVEIPAKFADVSQSGLTYQVTGGSQTHNVDLPLA